MEPDYLQDDLKAEVVLILLQMDEDKLQQLNERKQLNFYAVRIIMNLAKSKTSPFYKKYRVNNIQVIENTWEWNGEIFGGSTASIKNTVKNNTPDDLKDREDFELLQDAAIGAIETLGWYEKEIIKLYIKFGNYRAIETDTGIPWESCYTTIQKAIKKIRCKLAITS